MEYVMGDQAEGLRRIFNATQPKVLAVVPCGVVTISWVAEQLIRRAGLAPRRRTLVLDEWETYGNLGDCLGLVSRFDLLHAASGQVDISQCVLERDDGLGAVRTAALARRLGQDRIAGQRCLKALEALQAGFDEWLLMARFDPLEGFSACALAASHVMLVVDDQPKSATLAWAALSRLRKRKANMHFSVCAGNPDARTLALQASFCALAKARLGAKVEAVMSLEQVFGGILRNAGVFSDSFMSRLLQTCQGQQNGLFEGGFPGIAADDPLRVP
jgi:hypothetical protein